MSTGVGLEKELGGAKASASGGVRWKTVALPNEHGGWGITLEPVVLGLLVARAAYGFRRAWPSTARRLGFSEIGFGALTVFTVAAGHLFGI